MTPRKSALVWRLVLPVAIAILPLTLAAQNGARTPDDILKAESYQTPPKELADAVLAPRYLNVTLIERQPRQEVVPRRDRRRPGRDEDLLQAVPRAGRPVHRLQGEPRPPLTVRNNVGIQIISAADGTKKMVQLPAGARVSNAAWSPDSKSDRVLRPRRGRDAHLDRRRRRPAQSRQVTKTPVLATLVSSFDFTKDGKQIAAVLVPDSRTAMPQEPVSPPGPTVKLALDTDKNRLRTFPSLMSTPYQEQLLEWHTTGQLALDRRGEGHRQAASARRR